MNLYPVLFLLLPISLIGCSKKGLIESQKLESTSQIVGRVANSEFNKDDIPAYLLEDCARYKREQYVILIQAKRYTGSAVGVGGTKPQHYFAFECMLNSENASQNFQSLLSSENLVAQLYGLTGLYIIGDERYERIKRQYELDGTRVNCLFGCLGGGWEVSDIVKYIESLTPSEVMLSAKQSIKRRNLLIGSYSHS